jgi:hypothetical protein
MKIPFIERNKDFLYFYEITALIIYTLHALTSARGDEMAMLDISDQTSRPKWWLFSVAVVRVDVEVLYSCICTCN